SDRIHRYPGARAFLRQRLGEAMDPGLRRGIIDLAVLPGLAVDRADVDDPTIAAAYHSFEHRLGHVEAATEVRINHLLPLLMIHPLHRRIARDPRIVHQHIDRPDLRLDLLDALLAGIEIRHVPFVGADAGARGELARSLVVAGVIGRDLHPHVAKCDADRFADTA